MRAGHTDSLRMGRLIINCDLGENESPDQTSALLSVVDAANICCGVHAGSAAVTANALSLAKARKVMVGAHPGLSGAGGRGSELPDACELTALLELQVGGLLLQAAEIGVAVDYIKLHGSLYNAVERRNDLLECYLTFVAGLSPQIGIFALAGGSCAQLAKSRGIKFWAEAFADRAYQPDGQLVSRQTAGAVLTPEAALSRFQQWRTSGHMPTLCGGEFPLEADTLCVHGDSDGALELARALSF